jgi:hypothetical protein
MTTSHPSASSATSAIGAKAPSLAAIRDGHLSTKAWAGVGGRGATAWAAGSRKFQAVTATVVQHG